MNETLLAAVPILRFDDAEVARRKQLVELGSDDIARVKAMGSLVHDRIDELVNDFFDHLTKLSPEAFLFKRRDLLGEAKTLKREHLLALVNGEYDVVYIEQRRRLGSLYSKGGIAPLVFLGAFHRLTATIEGMVMQNGAKENFALFLSFQKVAFFDVGIIVDVLVHERERTIRMQQEAIRELSTPVLQVRDRLLILPIIGIVDAIRGKQITDTLLHAVRAKRAKIVVMDITGVGAVDASVANSLLQIVAACRLMGASVTVTGISAEMAQVFLSLGIDLSALITMSDLQSGLEDAERRLSTGDLVEKHFP